VACSGSIPVIFAVVCSGSIFFAVGLRKQGHRWLFPPRRSRHLFGNKLILSHYNFLLAISWTMLFSMILKKFLAGGSEYF
jgi:hypothetical protein